MLVRHSNQLSYEATDGHLWMFLYEIIAKIVFVTVTIIASIDS